MTDIPLRHWIKGALKSNESGGSLAPAYITSSLRIAIFIAKQIHEAEKSNSLLNGLDLLPPPFPLACIDWAECVSVNLKPNDNSLPFDSNDVGATCPSGADERSSTVDELIDEFARYLDEECADSPRTGAANIRSYLDINCAHLSSGGFVSNGITQADTPREKLHRIYSLGLLFYELFSGGQLPPPDFLVVSSPNGGDLAVIGEGLGFTNYDTQGASVDFANALYVSDGTGVATGDVCGGLNNSNVLWDISSNRKDMDMTTNKRRQSSRLSVSSRQGPGSSQVLRDVSAECLKMKGVPGPLCDLICNMIDAINGNFRRNDTYGEISDVIDDLDLMLVKPSLYLHDLDVEKLSLTGLELDETMFAQDDEFAALQCACQRSLGGACELAIITGSSGTGKSKLAHKLGNVVMANGTAFLWGKFDQMEHVTPFSAVASAFNDYCGVLALDELAHLGAVVASKLKDILGPDVYYLVQLIPNLSRILTDDFSNAPVEQNVVNCQERLHYLFCLFVGVISSCSRGLVLFMDDMQWASSGSISIISHLLKSSRSFADSARFFFVGCCRDDEIEGDHAFWQMTNSLGALGFNTTLVKLGCWGNETVNQVVSNLLHLSPRLVRSLSDIVYHKTKGNPMFVTRMLLSLNRDGLLRVNLANHRWEWDEGAIQSMKLPGDVANLFVQRIDSLPPKVKMALSFLSCLGAATDCQSIELLEAYLKMEFVEPFNVAIAEGLVNKTNGGYFFAHDKIQEASYGIADKQDLCLQHMKIGLALVDLSSGGENTDLFFRGVNQLNLASPSAVSNKNQYSLIANYNLQAGKLAMAMSEHSAAYTYFDYGISFLRKNHWKEHYDLSLELFNLAAKTALTTKNLEVLTMLCDQILRMARSPDDMLEASFVSMSVLAYGNITKAVQYGLTVLSSLGVSVPTSATRDDALSLLMSTQMTLSAVTDETLLEIRIVTDFKVRMAMKFLARLELCLFQSNPALQPFVTIKMVQLTLEHGICNESPIGFCYFGGMIAELGDIRGGYRFAKLATMLLDKHKFLDSAGEVIWLSTELRNYIEPQQSANEYRKEGKKTAIAAGDVHWACLLSLMYAAAVMYIGSKLSVAKENIANASHFSEEHRHLTSLYYLKSLERTVSKLIGDESLTDDELTGKVLQNKNPHQLVIIYFQNLQLSVWFNEYSEMKLSAEKFVELRPPSWFLLSNELVQDFYLGLASFRIYRETKNDEWMERGNKCKEKMTKWKEEGSVWNCENKSDLLHAEECHANGDFGGAEVFYDKAIAAAKAHKFVSDEALACELAGNFFFNIGCTSMSLKYFVLAHEKCLEWGALGKTKLLFEFIQEKFGNTLALAAAASGDGAITCSLDFHRKRHL